MPGRDLSLADSARTPSKTDSRCGGQEPGPLFCSQRENGGLVRNPDGGLHHLSAAAV